MTRQIRIIPGRPGDVTAVASLVARAFEPLPAVAWLVPDPADRFPVMRAQFALLVEHAVRHGQVWLTDDRAAASVWFARDRALPEVPDYDRRLTAATGVYVERFRLLDTLFADHHPSTAHGHLALLAVTPERQGTGLGTALLRHGHDRLDRAAMPAYLEASSSGSRDLYARHGYRAMPPFCLPDGTAFYPMWRPPARLRPEPGS